METLWFLLITGMFAAYVVFDGFDLGAGAVQLAIGKEEGDRAQILRSVGPVWDGNEVWLIAAASALLMAFPAAFSLSMSGMYLGVTLIVWCLIGRGVAIELRSHLEAPIWQRFWDTIFGVTSALLTMIFGLALGNVVRGLWLTESGQCFAPLWTDLGFGSADNAAGLIDWYTALFAIISHLVLIVHGALWVALKTHDPLSSRARQFAARVGFAVLPASLVLFGVTWHVQPNLSARLSEAPWGWLLLVAVIASQAYVVMNVNKGNDLKAFVGSSVYLVVMIGCAAFTIFPYILPSCGLPGTGLHIEEAVAGTESLGWALWWFLPGMALVTGYFVVVYRSFRGKVSLEAGGH